MPIHLGNAFGTDGLAVVVHVVDALDESKLTSRGHGNSADEFLRRRQIPARKNWRTSLVQPGNREGSRPHLGGFYPLSTIRRTRPLQLEHGCLRVDRSTTLDSIQRYSDLLTASINVLNSLTWVADVPG